MKISSILIAGVVFLVLVVFIIYQGGASKKEKPKVFVGKALKTYTVEGLKVNLTEICINGVLYYAVEGVGLTPALNTESEVLLCE